jgi:hypothetical protein
MNVEKIIRDWAAKAAYNSIHCTNEEQVRDFLVAPFFQLLGFAARDPRVFATEYRINLGSKPSSRADLVLFAHGRPEIVVECKRAGRNLNDPDHWRQLAEYANAIPDVSVGVLTNGVQYKFYAETDEPDSLDRDPFLEIDLNTAQDGLNELQIEFFSAFVEPAYDEGKIEAFAAEELIRRRMIAWLSGQLKDPSDEFCRLALRGQNVTHVRDLKTYKALLKDAFAHGLAAEIYEQVKKPAALRREGTSGLRAKLAAGVETTAQELKIFDYVKQRVVSLGANKVERDIADRILFADSSKKFSIYYLRPQKGRLLDYFQLKGEDKFIFPAGFSASEVSGIENIDKPLMAVLRDRIERAKSWNITNIPGYAR